MTKTKRIILSLLVVTFAAAGLALGTSAYFSDTETSEGNVLAAGSIDLRVDNTSYYNGLACVQVDDGWQWANPADIDFNDPYLEGLVGKECSTSWLSTDLTDELFFNFDDLKPGDWGEDTISLFVDNNDSYLCADVTYTESNENTLTEPEEEIGDDTETGELQNYITFVYWADDGDNVLEEGERWLGETVYNLGDAVLGESNVVTLADSQFNAWTGEPGPVEGAETYFVGKAWCFGGLTPDPVPAGDNNNPTIDPGIECSGEGNQNDAQSDSVLLDIAFTAVQSRNNEGFVCSSLSEEGYDTSFFDNWPSVADDNFETLLWQAEGRWGNNGPTGDWELGVGPNTQTTFNQTNYVWGSSGDSHNFSVVYDGVTGLATFTIAGSTTDYNVGGSLGEALYLVARADNGGSDTTVLTNLVLDGVSLPDVTATTDAKRSLRVDGASLTDGFTLTGTVVFNTTSPNGSSPEFQVQVAEVL